MNKEMEKLRKNIDAIDKKISDLLEKREKMVKKVGKLKKKNRLPIQNTEIEQKKLKKLKSKYKKNIFKKIFSESKKLQKH